MVAMTAPGANVSTKNRRSRLPKHFPTCDWCGERFKQSRSDQKYCCPNHRRDACERRKQETIRTLAGHFASYGFTEKHASNCVEYDLTFVKNILVMLGYSYQERSRRW